MRYFLLALLLIAQSAAAAPAKKTAKKPAKKPKAAATAPAAPESSRAASPQAPTSAPANEDANKASGGTGENLDVTITGESKDQVPVEIDPPPTEIAFRDMIGMARDGQTERVLNGPVETIPGGELLSMALLEPRQAIGSLPAKIPSPPFIQMEVATGLEPARWDFRVLDQDNKLIYRLEGTGNLRDLLMWDGFENGLPKLLAGQVYTPLLIITTKTGKIDRYYGEPVLLDMLQYVLGGERHIEFLNDRLFAQGSSEIPADMAPLLKALLGALRRNAGAALRVTVYHASGEGILAAERIKTLRTLLSDALLVEEKTITFGIAPSAERGEVTDFVLQGIRP